MYMKGLNSYQLGCKFNIKYDQNLNNLQSLTFFDSLIVAKEKIQFYSVIIRHFIVKFLPVSVVFSENFT